MKQRIITGIIFGIVVLFLVNYNLLTTSIFLGIIGIFSIWEYMMMVFTKELTTKVALYTLIELVFAYILIADEGHTIPNEALLYMSIGFLIFGIVSLYIKKMPNFHYKFAMFHAAVYIVLPLALLYKYLPDLSISPSEALMSILCFIWISDSAAYFVGSKMGKHKLFERISPGKTWEGSIGAGIIAILVAILISFNFPTQSIAYWVILAISIAIFGTYGDLYESSIKRKLGYKDSGHILPGHGGFLDRFDSFLFVVPIVLLIWKFMGY